MAESTFEFEIERVDSKDVRVDSREEKMKTKKTLSVKSRLQTFRVDSCTNKTKKESTLGRAELILPHICGHISSSKPNPNSTLSSTTPPCGRLPSRRSASVSRTDTLSSEAKKRKRRWYRRRRKKRQRWEKKNKKKGTDVKEVAEKGAAFGNRKKGKDVSPTLEAETRAGSRRTTRGWIVGGKVVGKQFRSTFGR
ncbi:hypothetical protein PIB30_100122 [Stylosanthes scabra]|uniref:Uncharacterized protein n=1 Tax=Stylosanthes scabra TaxID=79078 RepID=A0ABU6SXD6_9FABA|nr:hypothetical protein [Stylosanthes scabra]